MDRALAVVVFWIPLFLGVCNLLLILYDYLPPSPLSGDLHQNQALDFLSQNGTGHTVTIDYCFACAYGGNALETKEMLETQFPGIDVALVNYPDSPWRRVVGKMIPVVYIGSVVSVAAGDRIFPKLEITPPPWYYQISATKIHTIYAFSVSRVLLMSMLQYTGAFEVYLDGKVVFSKLDQRRFLWKNE